ncbi:DNA-binding response regulator [Candidatus Peregrinibacteria bacterium CG10_big_fil_rev_8_21_14_0_10_49_10]|nr:MAG: DNA-binding response regulator [Candidatus Peregrinibacteria bacterium CG10_big_fil_rev_8_21_14_0_10_49_10]
MRILIVEDNYRLARNIQSYLQSQKNYTASVAFDGNEGLEKAMEKDYDCIVLDVKLPGQDGFAICAALRKDGIKTPILMLTALSDEKNAVRGLDAGADDYLRKPFALEELAARIRALLRRDVPQMQLTLTAGSITLDPNTQTVWREKNILSLAPKEYALLEFLLRNKGRVQDRKTIIEHVWGEHEDALFSQTLDVHMSYLRKKTAKNLITTIPGKGYMISPLQSHAS